MYYIVIKDDDGFQYFGPYESYQKANAKGATKFNSYSVVPVTDQNK